MDIGIPTEIKDNESRVALTPAGAAALTGAGHTVRVQRGAGVGSGFADAEYVAAGAVLCDAAQAWDCELVVKVKEPLAAEYGYLSGQMLFTYLHLAGVDPALTEVLLASRTTGIGYETVRDAAGHLPLLAPMSAIAGNMAVAVGAWYLAKPHGGIGVQLGRVLGEAARARAGDRRWRGRPARRSQRGGAGRRRHRLRHRRRPRRGAAEATARQRELAHVYAGGDCRRTGAGGSADRRRAAARRPRAARRERRHGPPHAARAR